MERVFAALIYAALLFAERVINSSADKLMQTQWRSQGGHGGHVPQTCVKLSFSAMKLCCYVL